MPDAVRYRQPVQDINGDPVIDGQTIWDTVGADEIMANRPAVLPFTPAHVPGAWRVCPARPHRDPTDLDFSGGLISTLQCL